MRLSRRGRLRAAKDALEALAQINAVKAAGAAFEFGFHEQLYADVTARCATGWARTRRSCRCSSISNLQPKFSHSRI